MISHHKRTAPPGINGQLFVKASEIGTQNNFFVRMKLSGVNLDKKDTFSKSDPYVVISKATGSTNEFTPVIKTEVIKNTLNPGKLFFVLKIEIFFFTNFWNFLLIP